MSISEPFLRPATPEGDVGAPCPPGHEAEPAGMWHGEAMEVVYDPRRHDVAFLRGGVSARVREGLVDTGWRHQLSDGDNQMWTRDRAALTRSRLQRPASPGSPDPVHGVETPQPPAGPIDRCQRRLGAL